MNYAEQLEQLKLQERQIIEEAKKEGYKYINNQLVKNDYVPVMEIYARSETQYESTGHYYIFKKTILLTPEQLDVIINTKHTQDKLADFVEESFLTKIKELDPFYEILSLCNSSYLDSENINYIVDKKSLKERYHLNNGQKLYMEFFFEDNRYVDGYVSVYDIRVEDFEKQQDVNLTLSKYLRFNM